ncbi:ATP-binding cassette domain-containing protein [Streptomyces sp. NPDC093018]|uniref:ABC transporter ATP-binding protein n=1 Tax=Streptomyces sp. NPDC093018 TaxID=3155067 RepID=UPI0034229DAA
MTLRLDDITVTLGRGSSRTTALRSLTAVFQPGLLTALVGPSGSGKSTLLAVAGALLRPDEGRVLLGDTDLAALGDRERARARRTRVGYMFQSGNLLTGLTTEEQLLAAASVAGHRPRAVRARARDLLAEVGLAHRLRHRPDQLSGGERRRVALARALLVRPELLLVDEPTAAVDRTRADDLTRLIARTTHEYGCVTVVATHDPVVVEAADRTIDMLDHTRASAA